jgi:hypothetical protein
MKCKTCGSEIESRFPDGVDYNYVIVECDCYRHEECVADNKDEDCNLYERLKELRFEKGAQCKVCNKFIRYSLITK